jgi:hypothetical protein
MSCKARAFAPRRQVHIGKDVEPFARMRPGWLSKPATYNQPDPRIPDLVISRPDLAARVIAAAREWALRGAKRL